MIKIFGVQETTEDLETLNGDIVLTPSKAIMRKYENGEYSLELEAGYEFADFFEQNRLVVVDLPFGGQEFFRMNNPVKSRGKCKCKCYQVFNDMKYCVRPFDAVTSYTCNNYYDLLSYMNGNYGGYIGGNGSFTIDDYSTSGVWDFPEQSFNLMGTVFSDVVESMIKKYGGYLYRNKRSFGISKNRIITDRGVTIRYGANLKAITKEEDWSDVCTYLLAIGSAGIEKAYTNSTQLDYKYNKILKFQQNIDPADYQTAQAYSNAVEYDLNDKVAVYFRDNTLPHINYTLDAYVGELPDGSGLEIQDIGDQVEVIDEQLGISLMTSVLGFDFDLLLNKYNKIEFGNYATSMRGYNDKVKSEIDTLQKNVTNISYPVGSVFQCSGAGNPSTYGLTGYWTLVSSSGGIYTWKRTA